MMNISEDTSNADGAYKMEQTLTKTSDKMEETLALLKEGDKNIEVSNFNNVILFLGNTGSGKSTLTQFIAGDNNLLISEEVEEDCGEYIIVDNKRIGSTIESQTIFPEFVFDSATNTAYYDCPGFSDTRSVSMDIGSTYFIKKIIDKADAVKLVFVISHPSVQKGVDRQDFKLMVEHAVNLIKDIDKFKTGIALLVTKVNNVYKRKGKECTLVSDEATIKNIAGFLKEAQTAFQEKQVLEGNQLYERIVQLINIFLTKENDKLVKIGIFRRPEEPGPLSEISLLQEEKGDINCLLQNNIDFISKDEQDFGYTISESSKNVIFNLVDKINEDIKTILVSIGEDIQKHFQSKVDLSYDLYQLQIYLDEGYKRCSKILEEITEMETADTLLTKIMSFTNYLKIDVPDDSVQDIRSKSNYLSFLQIVSNKTFKSRHLEWIQLLSNVMQKIKEFKQWNKLFLDMYTQLSEYTIQKDTSKYNVAYLEDWGVPEKERGIYIHSENFELFLNKLDKYDSDLMQQFKHSSDSIKEEKLKKVNDLLTITLKDDVEVLLPNPGKLYPEADRLVIKGTYVKFSEVFDSKIDDKIKKIDIFSSNTVFIDADFVSIGSNIQLAIIAPKWVIEGSRSIILDGIAGPAHLESRAADALYIKHEVASYGEQGKPGLPGGCGGHFIGIVQEIIGDSLTISANGGMGGPGQDGGNGASGYRGEDGQIPIAKDSISSNDDGLSNAKNIYEELNSGWNDFEYSLSANINYIIYGTSGGIGTDGNVGGKGGIGGNPGKVMLFTPCNKANVTLVTNKGLHGDGGKGGKRGIGGENGFTVSAKLEERITTYGKSFHWESNYIIPMGRAPFGKRGADNINKTGIKNPDVATEFLQPSHVINKYKNYLRENITDGFKRNLLNKFDKYLNNNPDILSFYDTLGLVNELQEIENQYYILQEVDFKPYYQSLLERVSRYAESPKSTETSPQYKKILSYLFTAVHSRICKLRSALEPNLIIDISEYLNLSILNINSMKEKRENFTKNSSKQNYLDKIKNKIDEANEVIGKIVSEIDYFTNQMDKQVDFALNDVIELRSHTESKKHQLQKKQTDLKNKLVIKKVFDVLSTVGYVAHYVIPVFGGVINAGVKVTTIVSSQFLLNDKPKRKVKEEELSFDKNFNLHNLKNKKNFSNEADAMAAHFVKLITSLSTEINAHSKILGGAEIRVKELVANLNALCSEKELHMPKIRSLANELMSELKLTDFELKSEKEHIDEETLKLFKEVDKFCRASSVSNVSITVYNQNASNEGNLTEVSNAIKQAQEEMDNLEKYENNLFTNVIPMLNSMRSDFGNLETNLSSKSEIALRIIKNELKEMLLGMKMQMKQFDKQFHVHENLCRCIDKLDETMNTLVNVYSQIRKYYDDKMLADYIAEINSPTANSIGITDEELQAAFVNLEFLVNSNVVLAQYDEAFSAFKQWVFPFAHYYLEKFKVLSVCDETASVQNLVDTAANQIESLKKDVLEYKSSIKVHDRYVHLSKFNSYFKSSEPFFVWKNESNRNMITKLLSGEEIILKADVKESSPNKNAIKFDLIELNFKSQNETIQRQLDQKLKNYQVEMTHLGQSYYRCGRNIYVIKSDSQTICYTYEKTEEGIPVTKNVIYDKIVKGDLMLSPYAMWRFKLINYNGDSSDLTGLKGYGNTVDLELVGNGQFTHKDVNIDNLKLDRYYTANEVIPSDNMTLI